MTRVNTPAPIREAERSARVLLVVADRALSNTIDLTLRHGEYVSRSEVTVKEAKAAIAEWKPHLLSARHRSRGRRGIPAHRRRAVGGADRRHSR
jgi:hypothetical protein